MDINTIRKKNLMTLIRRHRTQREFAAAVGTAPAYISQIVSAVKTVTGKERGVGDELARKVEDRLGLERGWMDVFHDEQPEEVESNYGVYPGPSLRGKIPLLSWSRAGEMSLDVDLQNMDARTEWVDVTVQVHPQTFALRVENDSMAPDFPVGVLLVVEPSLDAHAGDYVIAKNGTDEATFKQLVKDGSDWYLKPINTSYPMKPFELSRVVGVVRQAIRKIR